MEIIKKKTLKLGSRNNTDIEENINSYLFTNRPD